MTKSHQIIATRLSAAKPSASIAAKASADAMRAAGREIIDFTTGEPDFPTPGHIVQAGVQALQSGHTRYTASAGTLALRQAVLRKLSRENQLSYEIGEVVVGSGAKPIIFNAFMATLEPGDEVIVPAPYWVSYPEMVLLNGGVPKVVECTSDTGFKISAAALANAITQKTKWLVLNSPNNPSGAVYSEDELRAIGEVLLKNPQVHILTDEIYEHFVYGSTRHLSLLNTTPALQSRTLLVNGCSKTYAMTGWRIGFGAGPAHLIKAITLLITQSTTCAAAAAQAAAAVALDGPQDCVVTAAKTFENRRNHMVQKLNAIDGFQCEVPDGAFYVFASVAGLIGRKRRDGRDICTDLDVAEFIREEAGVVAIDGTSYGLSPYLRFSFASSLNEIDKGCDAIAAAVSQLQH